MTDRPILFSGPMIRALLEGRKSQTRRILKPQPPTDMGLVGVYAPALTAVFGYVTPDADFKVPLRNMPGDRLWVREGWRTLGCHDHRQPSQIEAGEAIHYEVDGQAPQWTPRSLGGRRRPSMFMPRWASRLTLIVTDVRVQRLQEISEADALAEGVIRQDPTPDDEDWNLRWSAEQGLAPEPMSPVWLAPGTRQGYGTRRDEPQWGPTPEFAFRLLWDSLNAPRGFGWDANPWVVALTFDVIRQNIDAMGETA